MLHYLAFVASMFVDEHTVLNKVGVNWRADEPQA